MVIGGLDSLLVCQCRIQVNAYQSGGVRPLHTQVIGRADDQHTSSHSVIQVLMGDP
jgi:hypothetical protein